MDRESSDANHPSDELIQLAYRADRKRGILTKTDRKYLRGETDHEEQDERNLKYRMRERLKQAVLDLIFLADVYPREELEKVVEGSEFKGNSGIPEGALIELTYKWMIATESVDNPRETMEDVLQIKTLQLERRVANNRYIESVDVDIEVETESFNPDNIFSKIVMGKATYSELDAYWRVADIGRLERLSEIAEEEGIKVQVGDEYHYREPEWFDRRINARKYRKKQSE